MKFTPFIAGSGRSAQVLRQSLEIAAIRHPALQFHAPVQLQRGQTLAGLGHSAENPVLIVANPHALHAPLLVEADREGFALAVCEKPAAIDLDQVAKLRAVKMPVAVLHVYRQTWGLLTLREMAARGDFGEIVAIEGRYWQSSAAVRAGQKTTSWKNDVAVNGPSDTLLDVGVHWIDAAAFVLGDTIRHFNLWRSFANAETPHRDSHVHVQMEFTRGTRALASVSKTLHGASNHFEINVIGAKKYAAWKFLAPDQIELGEKSVRSYLYRSTTDLGTGHPPFHGAGWMEGYVEIIAQALLSFAEKRPAIYPTLAEHLAMLSPVLTALSPTPR